MQEFRKTCEKAVLPAPWKLVHVRFEPPVACHHTGRGILAMEAANRGAGSGAPSIGFNIGLRRPTRL
jgi:hypothetical protein